MTASPEVEPRIYELELEAENFNFGEGRQHPNWLRKQLSQPKLSSSPAPWNEKGALILTVSLVSRGGLWAA